MLDSIQLCSYEQSQTESNIVRKLNQKHLLLFDCVRLCLTLVLSDSTLFDGPGLTAAVLLLYFNELRNPMKRGPVIQFNYNHYDIDQYAIIERPRSDFR